MLQSCTVGIMKTIYIIPENRSRTVTVLDSTRSSATATQHSQTGWHHLLGSSLKKLREAVALSFFLTWEEEMYGCCIRGDLLSESIKAIFTRPRITNSYPAAIAQFELVP